jgi:hypothetical protein
MAIRTNGARINDKKMIEKKIEIDVLAITAAKVTSIF